MMLSMAVLLAAFSYAWHATGIPMIYMVSTLIAGPVVALFNIGMRHKMRSDAQPVSYTHLDVYKRQSWMSPPPAWISKRASRCGRRSANAPRRDARCC